MRTWCLLGISLFGVACSTSSPTGAPTAGTSAPQRATATHTSDLTAPPKTPVLAVLQTRDRRVELHSGTRITVRNNEGDLVAEDLSLDELQQRDPFLYEVCRTSFAGNDGTFLDARLDVRPDAPKSTGIGGD